MSYIHELQQKVEERLQILLGNHTRSGELGPFFNKLEKEAFDRKMDSFLRRGFEVVKGNAKGQVISERKYLDKHEIDYLVGLEYLIKQKNNFYVEENVERRRAILSGNTVIDDYMVEGVDEELPPSQEKSSDELSRVGYTYDRLKAVQYAERWWNSHNPKYKKIDVDCTNFISQCLHEGGIPMTGFGNRSKGWWYTGNNWSYSWTVAHALRWYLSGEHSSGLRAKEVLSATELMPGDVICYDFQGDGRWDHNTIVTAKDENNEPLVNAHTYDSRMRYWKYEDSTAWTPNIKYKFFHILDRR